MKRNRKLALLLVLVLLAAILPLNVTVSEEGAEVTVATVAASATVLTPPALTLSGNVLSWNSIANASHYELTLEAQFGATWSTLETRITATTSFSLNSFNTIHAWNQGNWNYRYRDDWYWQNRHLNEWPWQNQFLGNVQHRVRVRAIAANQTTHTNSAWSSPVTFWPSSFAWHNPWHWYGLHGGGGGGRDVTGPPHTYSGARLAQAPGAAVDAPAPGMAPGGAAHSLRFVVGMAYFQTAGTPGVVRLDAAPFIDPATDRTMLPLRAIAESMGATVIWDAATRSIEIRYGGSSLHLTIDAPLPDGMGVPMIVNDRTFVPLRYVSETLGTGVRWESATRAIYVY